MAPPIHLIPKVLIFDLTGTCVNWYDPIVDALNSCPGLGNISPGLYFTVDVLESLDSLSADQLAKDWRAGYFAEVQARLERGEVEEDIDVTHRRVLDQLLEEGKVGVECDEGVRQRLVKKWHKLPAWMDVTRELIYLRNEYDCVVLANGTTRLQLDLVRSSDLSFDLVLSSELLGVEKPDPKIYTKAVEQLERQPDNCLMVASRASDLRAAKKCGLLTAYIYRETEDPGEDIEKVAEDVDFFCSGMDDLASRLLFLAKGWRIAMAA